MQYKIPVQIENEDPIFLGLSLRQIMIILIGGGIAYVLFKSLVPKIGPEVAAIPSITILLIAIMVAIFKHSEMTFIPFVLSLIRYKVNVDNRKWTSGVDSLSPMDIGFLSRIDNKKEENVDFKLKMDRIKKLDDKLDKI